MKTDSDKLTDQVVKALNRAMALRQMTQSDLARIIDRHVAWVNRVVNGHERNLTVKTIALLLSAVDLKAEFSII